MKFDDQRKMEQKEAHMKSQLIVRFSCGCVGFVPTPDDRSWIIKPCDETTDRCEGMTLYDRESIGSKDYEFVNLGEERKFFEALAELVYCGHSFNDLSAILNRGKR